MAGPNQNFKPSAEYLSLRKSLGHDDTQDFTDAVDEYDNDPLASPVLTDKPDRMQTEKDVRIEALKQGVDPDLAAGVMLQESGGKADALSPTGVYGPMQVTERTARDLGYNRNIYKENIGAGVALLKRGQDSSNGDPYKALSGYPDPKDAGFWIPNVLNNAEKARSLRLARNDSPVENFKPSSEYLALRKELGHDDSPKVPKVTESPGILDTAGEGLKLLFNNLAEGQNINEAAMPAPAKSMDELRSIPEPKKYNLLSNLKQTGAAAGEMGINLAKAAFAPSILPGPGIGPVGAIEGMAPGITDRAVNYLQTIQQGEKDKAANEGFLSADQSELSLGRMPIAEDEGGFSKFGKGLVNKSAEMAEGLATPENLMLMGTGALGKVPAALAGMSFIPGLAEGAVKGVKDIYSGATSGDYAQAGSGLAQAIGSGGMTYLGAKHLGQVAPEGKILPVEPNEAFGRVEVPPESIQLPERSGTTLSGKRVFEPEGQPKAYVDTSDIPIPQGPSKLLAARAAEKAAIEAEIAKLMEEKRSPQDQILLPEKTGMNPREPWSPEKEVESHSQRVDRLREKVVRLDEQRTKERVGLITDINRLGGLKSDSPQFRGELRQFGIKEGGANLLRKDGLEPDKMAEALREQGYDVKDAYQLIDLIREDMDAVKSGKPEKRVTSGNESEANFKDMELRGKLAEAESFDPVSYAKDLADEMYKNKQVYDEIKFEDKANEAFSKYDPDTLEYDPAPVKLKTLDNPYPESPETLKAQVNSLRAGRVKALLETKGESVQGIPSRFKSIKTKVGTFYFDPMRISASRIEAMVENGKYHELLGHVEPKSPASTQTVAALDKSGNELKASLVSPENVQKQYKSLKKQFPESKIVTGGIELADKIIEQRKKSVARETPKSEDDLLASIIKNDSNEVTRDNLNFPNVQDKNIGPLNRLKSEKGSIGDLSEPKTEGELNAESYVQELTKAQDKARNGESQTVKDKAYDFYKEVKSKLVDSNAPIEDAIYYAQKKHGYEIPPEFDVTNQIDRTYRAPSLAGQFAEDHGIVRVIREVDNIKNLDQYMIAKHAKTLREKGIETGRDALKDEHLLKTFAPKYDAYAKIVTAYSRKLLDYSVDAGLISQDLSTKLKKAYPDYVPMQRIFSELEKATGHHGTGAVASLSKQTIVQKLLGSKREIESPTESLLIKTNDAFAQGEKNKAGRFLAMQKDMPGMKDLIREIKPGEHPAHKFSFLDNGTKRTFETTKEIEAAAKSLDVQQLNILGRILAFPVRIAKLGITGVNLPFAAANIVRDQAQAFLTSQYGLKTSVANPKLFAEALFNVLGHGELYKEMIRSGASGTSFDLARNQAKSTIKDIRSGKLKNIVMHPIRSIEDLIGVSEQVTRLMQFEGNKRQALKEGHSIKDANIIGAKESRANTVNFYRRGEWGKVLNGAMLYLNAGIQGPRSLLRSLERSPVKTVAKVAGAILLPQAMATFWNLKDDERRKVYADIEDYEKDNNIIIVPENPTQDDKGNWNVYKLPMPKGVSSLTIISRKFLEQAYDVEKLKFEDMANALIGTVSPVEPNVKSILNTATPQLIKPSLEQMTNKNFFTGKNIVPEYFKNRPEEKQVYDWTSGTARKIGKMAGVSPIQVEQFIKSTFGGVGSQALRGSDLLLNKAGVIPEEQIGGQDPLEASLARFTKARGGRMKRLKKEKRNK